MRTARPLLLVLLGFVSSCTGQGPDVVDPAANARNQTSVLALEVDGDAELAIVKEPDGIARTSAYSDANGGPLAERVDGIFSSFERLFLLHRASGSLTVVNATTRARIAEISGFGDSSRALCGVAFSNISQGWAIDHETSAVFHFDAVNHVVVDTLPIEGKPTSVATIGDRVFVASQRPDGSGLVSIFRSNFSSFRVEQTLTYPSPIVFMGANAGAEAMILLSAGTSGGRPTVHSIRFATMTQTAERTLNAPPLSGRIGTVPEFATISSDNYLYVATQDLVYRLDVGSSRLSSTPQEWLDGSFDVIGVDHWTDLLYAYDRTSSSLLRMDRDGNRLDPLAVPRPVTAIEFVNPSGVQ